MMGVCCVCSRCGVWWESAVFVTDVGSDGSDVFVADVGSDRSLLCL